MFLWLYVGERSEALLPRPRPPKVIVEPDNLNTTKGWGPSPRVLNVIVEPDCLNTTKGWGTRLQVPYVIVHCGTIQPEYNKRMGTQPPGS